MFGVFYLSKDIENNFLKNPMFNSPGRIEYEISTMQVFCIFYAKTIGIEGVKSIQKINS